MQVKTDEVHYECWQAAGGQGHHLCKLPIGHTGEHLLPELGRTRKRAPSTSIDLGRPQKETVDLGRPPKEMMPHRRFTPLQHERFRLVELVDDILAIIIRQLVDSQPRAALRLLQVCTVLRSRAGFARAAVDGRRLVWTVPMNPPADFGQLSCSVYTAVVLSNHDATARATARSQSQVWVVGPPLPGPGAWQWLLTFSQDVGTSKSWDPLMVGVSCGETGWGFSPRTGCLHRVTRGHMYAHAADGYFIVTSEANQRSAGPASGLPDGDLVNIAPSRGYRHTKKLRVGIAVEASSGTVTFTINNQRPVRALSGLPTNDLRPFALLGGGLHAPQSVTFCPCYEAC